jgi:hypothetical protein
MGVEAIRRLVGQGETELTEMSKNLSELATVRETVGVGCGCPSADQFAGIMFSDLMKMFSD